MFDRNKDTKEKKEALARAILDKWLSDKCKDLETLYEKIKTSSSDLQRIEEHLSQIESVKLHVPIENQFMLTPEFQQQLEWGYLHAEMEFAPIKRDQMSHYPTLIRGEVSNKEFSICAKTREYVLFFGLKVKYHGKDSGEFRMRIRDVNCPPFSIDADTTEIIFMKTYILRPEEYFGISKISGDGTLSFRLLGVSIAPNFFC